MHDTITPAPTPALCACGQVVPDPSGYVICDACRLDAEEDRALAQVRHCCGGCGACVEALALLKALRR